MMRAGLVACLAMGYRMWGARLDVAIDDVEVDVMCESDVRGQLGIADVPIGWQRIVVDVRIASARARGGRAARGRDGGSPEPDAREPVARDRARPPPARHRIAHAREEA